jgi:hypothetical protein
MIEFADTQCDKIANFLQDKLNTISLENYKFKVVKSIRNWNDENIPITDFPCLKVFRNGDTFSTNSYKVTSQLTVQYGVVITANYKYTPALNQIGKYIHTFLATIDEEDDTVIVSRNVPPTGQLVVSRGQNDYIYGWYTYQFAVEDQTVPSDLVQLFT